MFLKPIRKFGNTEGAIKAWETRRGGAGFASPNREEDLKVRDATRKLTSGEQQRLQKAGEHIDKLMGLKSSRHDVIGAWKDGAENSTMTRFRGASYDEVKTAMAMRGLLGEQKAVIPFKADTTGKSRLSSFKVGETDAVKLNQDLVKAGLENHTLEPTKGGYVVHVFQDKASTEMDHTVKAVAEHYGSTVNAVRGHGEFLGSWTSRADGRASYEKQINHYLAQPGHSQQRLDWQRTLKGWKFGLTKIDIAIGVQL
jgi:hypothetical protein